MVCFEPRRDPCPVNLKLRFSTNKFDLFGRAMNDIIWEGLMPAREKEGRTDGEVTSTPRKSVKAEKKEAAKKRHAAHRDTGVNTKTKKRGDNTRRVQFESSLDFSSEPKISPSKAAPSFGVRKKREKNIIPSVSEIAAHDVGVKVNDKKRKHSESDVFASPVKKKKSRGKKIKQLIFKAADLDVNVVGAGFEGDKSSTWGKKKKKTSSKKTNHVDLEDSAAGNNLELEALLEFINKEEHDDIFNSQGKIGRKKKKAKLSAINGAENGVAYPNLKVEPSKLLLKKKRIKKENKSKDIKEKKTIAELTRSTNHVEDKTDNPLWEIEVGKAEPLTNKTNSRKEKIKQTSDCPQKIVKKKSHLSFKVDKSSEEGQKSDKENWTQENKEWDISYGVSSDDSCDDATVQVGHLTYEELCDVAAENESRLSLCAGLNIPEEYFNDSDGSECAETSSEIDGDKRDDTIEQDSLPITENESIRLNEESILVNEEEAVEENALETEAEQDVPLQFLTLENDDKLIILNPGGTVHFYGLFLMEMLRGDVEILGAELCKESGPKKVYSPRGTASLYLKNSRLEPGNLEQSLNQVVDRDSLPPQWRETTVDVNSAVILCRKLKEHFVDFILKHMSQRVFPYEPDDSGPRIVFENLPGKIKVGEAWSVADRVTERTRLAICGGKGVGKSTLLRYTVNKLLKRFPKVRVIDLDPGQSEFFIPGTVSVATVSDYLLGPNYTHHQDVDRAILANINVAYDVKKYVKCVEAALHADSAGEAFPTVVNLCGYVTGLGVDVTMQVLRLIEPHMVLQIKSRVPSRNYPVDFISDGAEHLVLDSMAERGDAWKLDGRQAREINTLAYFGKMMSGSVTDLTSCDLNMYSINSENVKITNADGKSVSPLAVNANVVALCSRPAADHALFECHGWGFVRGVDLESGTVVLLTPEPLRVLDRADHVVLGSIAVPPSLIMSTGDVTGHAPYLNAGKPIDLGALTKRPYLPPKK